MLSRLYIAILVILIAWSSIAFFGPGGFMMWAIVFSLAWVLARGCSALTFLVLAPCWLVLIALALPAVSTALEAARRAQCAGNLKQIVSALMQYEQKHGHLPPAYISDKNGKPMHSWRVLILPFLREKDLYDRYRFDEPWDGPNNRHLRSERPKVFACPSDAEALPPSATTSYVAVVGRNADRPHDKPRHFDDPELRELRHSTIMLAEKHASEIAWTEPRDIFLEAMQAADSSAEPVTVSSAHGRFGQDLLYDYEYDFPIGANVAMLDGSVRFLYGHILTNDTLRKLLAVGGATDEAIDPPGPYRERQIAKTTLRLRSCIALAVWLVSVALLLRRAVRSRKSRLAAAALRA